MKTAIYIRVSTEEQAKEGYSISAQKQRLKAFCIAQDWEVVGMYVDEGISAKDMNRPQLQQLLKDIESGIVECVLVYRLDRLTRSVLDLYKMLEVFEKHDCKFKSATEVYDTTTAMGRMFITIVAALAQWERENMGERISMGYAEKVRQGKYALNFRPFGYDLDLKTGTLSVNHNEAKTVRLIYDLYMKGYGANRICQYLNSKEIRTRDGNNWNDKPLMQIIKNPLYKGSIRWRDFVVDDAHEPIISKDEFEQVQLLVEKRKKVSPRRVSSDFIFTGTLKCKKCGSAMVGSRSSSKGRGTNTYKFYRCNKGKTGQCKGSKSIAERKLEEAFLNFLSEQNFNSIFEQVAAAGEKLLNANTNQANEEKDQLQIELQKIEKRKKKWQYAWSEDLISNEDFRIRMDEAKKEIEKLENQLASYETVEEEVAHFSKIEIMSTLEEIQENWIDLEDFEKKQLIESIIEGIHYNITTSETGHHTITIESIDFY